MPNSAKSTRVFHRERKDFPLFALRIVCRDRRPRRSVLPYHKYFLRVFAPHIASLPCVKGGGTACRDGGTVKSDNLHKTIPQSALLTAPFTQGSLSHKHILRLSFICFLLIGKAFFEPRHYDGVFAIQNKYPPAVAGGYYMLIKLCYNLKSAWLTCREGRM